jgi:calreticulin
VRSGSLAEDWDFLEPKEIKDPAVSKPADWVDAKKIPDPEDVKPEGYDDVPAQIPDPDATMPDDWDEEEDGEYEPPSIPNPDYMGEWKPKMIENPDYNGEWEHPVIPNPDFKEDPELYQRCKDCTHIGFELWQVKSGTIFDDILVTDSWAEAQEIAEKDWVSKAAAEKVMYDAAEAEKKAAADAAAAAAEEEEDDEDEEEDMEDMADEL